MKTLIASLAFASLVVLSTTASAAGAYIGVYGGANWDDVIDSPSKFLTIKDKTGTVLGGVIGMPIASVPGLSVELDASWRQNDVDLNIFKTTIHASHETTALMANAVYAFPTTTWPVHPHLKAGVGYGYTKGTFEDLHIATVEASGVTWQVGGGLSTNISEGVSVSLDYTYMQAPEIEVFGLQLSDGTNQTVTVGINFAL